MKYWVVGVVAGRARNNISNRWGGAECDLTETVVVSATPGHGPEAGGRTQHRGGNRKTDVFTRGSLRLTLGHELEAKSSRSQEL